MFLKENGNVVTEGPPSPSFAIKCFSKHGVGKWSSVVFLGIKKTDTEDSEFGKNRSEARTLKTKGCRNEYRRRMELLA